MSQQPIRTRAAAAGGRTWTSVDDATCLKHCYFVKSLEIRCEPDARSSTLHDSHFETNPDATRAFSKLQMRLETISLFADAGPSTVAWNALKGETQSCTLAVIYERLEIST